MPSNCIADLLSSLIPGLEVTFENLTMVPLLARSPKPAGPGSGIPDPGSRTPDRGSRLGPPDYAVLDDALASGFVEITELSEQGSVPELRVVNRGASPVLIIDGEELVGAKQNRVVNLTILVAAQSALTIPVSCVEAGRWTARSRAFAAAPRTQYASGRAKRVAQVTQSIRDHGVHTSDQAGVWADIAALSSRLQTSSATGAMQAVFDQHAGFIDRCVDACRPVDGQVGALFSIDGRVVGLDLFDRESTLRTLLPKLVRSVAVDALDSTLDSTLSRGFRLQAEDRVVPIPKPRRARRRGKDAAAISAAQQFLAVTSVAAQHVSPGVGMGEDVRLSAHAIAGAALVANGGVIHLSAFAVN
jgi:ARG/rhodanese/phosphatase superfamily protein